MPLQWVTPEERVQQVTSGTAIRQIATREELQLQVQRPILTLRLEQLLAPHIITVLLL